MKIMRVMRILAMARSMHVMYVEEHIYNLGNATVVAQWAVIHQALKCVIVVNITRYARDGRVANDGICWSFKSSGMR